ncbi:hypothetical protein [Marilutibacter alkalisoli]|uniref:Uncharacterized protein n=1 Tax=Marilutibacter alkalisoli TaxID=2591633 RepID=A0A514BU29_9GAMM|nr:hypothetical protein [Lysobacter alkalisoli]QDH70876.1 hypothetical protein FKV23_12865 [Lysobacter alkalisoli]
MTKPRTQGRADAVRDYLRAHPRGATFRELLDAIEPGAKANNMAAYLANAVKRGKLDKRGLRFAANARTFTDGRSDPQTAPAKQRKAKPAQGTQHAGCAAEIARVKKARTPKPQPTPEASVPIARAFRTSLAIHVPGIEARRPAREAIAADVAAFIAAGGVIQRFAPGETAESVREKEARLANEYGRTRNLRARRAA